MRSKAFYVVAAFAVLEILIAAPASAQSPKDDRAAQKAAIEQFYRNYIADFMAGDPKKIAAYYNEPLMLVGVGKVIGTTAEIEKFIAGVRGDLPRDYEFVLDQLSVKLIGKNVALLSYTGERRAKDGAILQKTAGSSFLRKTDTGWKIATSLSYPQEDFIKVD
jgi:ketosteroid isomerase-like protein